MFDGVNAKFRQSGGGDRVGTDRKPCPRQATLNEATSATKTTLEEAYAPPSLDHEPDGIEGTAPRQVSTATCFRRQPVRRGSGHAGPPGASAIRARSSDAFVPGASIAAAGSSARAARASLW